MGKYNKVKVSFKGWIFEMVTNEKIAKGLSEIIKKIALTAIWVWGVIDLIHAIAPNGFIH
jgi:hypothetical protein